MPLVAAWENQLVEKVQEQGGVHRHIVPIQSTFAGFKTHFGYTFIIPTSFDVARLCVPLCLIAHDIVLR